MGIAEIDALAGALVTMGCPRDKAKEMAGQLDKRAWQLSEQTGRSYDEALTHLLKLFQNGWAAKSGPDQH